MKKFVYSVFTVFVILYICFIILDFSITKNLYKSKDFRLMGMSEVLTDTLDAQIVILGNSRAYRHFNTDLMSTRLGVSCYNLGIDAAGVNRQIFKYKVYLKKNIEPCLLFVNVDPFSFCLSSKEDKSYLIPFINNKLIENEIGDVINVSFFEKNLPFYRYLGYQSLIRLGLNIDMSTKINTKLGYLRNQDIMNDVVVEGDYKSLKDSTAISDFTQFMKTLSPRTKVYFVKSPIYLGDNNQTNFIDSIAESNNIKIIDFMNDSICQNKKYFANRTHLNALGSDIFTSKFVRYIQNDTAIQKWIIKK